VKHGRDAELRRSAEPFRIAPELEQRVGGCLHEQLEDETPVANSGRVGPRKQHLTRRRGAAQLRGDARHPMGVPVGLSQLMSAARLGAVLGLIRKKSRVPYPFVRARCLWRMEGPMPELDRAVKESWRRFLELYEPLRPELYRYCRHLTRSAWDAEGRAHHS
jgi:hypothetical protein